MSQQLLVAIFSSHQLSLALAKLDQSAEVIKTISASYQQLDQLPQIFDQLWSQLSADSFKQISLILPHTWVDIDGKISPQVNSYISATLQTHHLQPLGFMSSDEAILDYYCQQQGIPVSPLLVEIDDQNLLISLSDMGQIIKRSTQPINPNLSLSQQTYQLVSQLKPESVISPQILVWGSYNSQTVLDFNNFSWLNKSDSDFFLHFPNILFFDNKQAVNIFCQSISRQVSQTLVATSPLPTATESDLDFIPATDEPDSPSADQPSLMTVSAQKLGFSSVDNLPSPSLPLPSTLPVVPPPVKKTIKLPLPKFSKGLLFYTSVLASLIISSIFIFYFFVYQVHLDIFVSPSEVNITNQVTFNQSANTISISSSDYQINSDQQTINVTDQIKTTGSKTIGETAQGKLIIYNKTDETILLKKGQLLKTESGLSFVLINDIQVEASSVDLQQGVISMGKTTAVASASQIGSDGNIVESSQLSVDGYTSDQLMARVSESFSGGSSRQVSSVSSADKQQLTDRLQQKLTQTIEQNNSKISQPFLLISTVQTTSPKIEFNREVGEESDILSATMEAVVSYRFLDSSVAESIINQLSPQHLNWPIDLATSKLKFDLKDSQLIITGLATVKLDSGAIKTSLLGRRPSVLDQILKSKNSRIYDYNLKSNNPFGLLPLLPLAENKINLEIKTEI